MSSDALPQHHTRQFSIRMRSRGQLTIPRKLRENLSLQDGDVLNLIQVGDGLFLAPKALKGPELAERFAKLMAEGDVSLADLLEDLPHIREELHHERYGDT